VRARWLLVLLMGCSECGAEPQNGPNEEPEPNDEATAATLQEYFPVHVGDRWRYHNADERSVRTVTSSENGEVVIVGDDRTAPLRLRVSQDAVAFLDVEGQEVGRLLETPLELGHEWEYTLGDVQCGARYAAVDDEVEVGGLTVNACLVVHRRCLHPAGKPFPVETIEQHSETYCPFIGRVREEMRLEPNPLQDSDGRDDVLAYYRVAGAPAAVRPEPFGCDAFLITLSDVQAACGPLYRQTNVRDEDGVCEVTYAGADSSLVLEAQRAHGAPDAVAAEGEELRLVEENGSRVVIRSSGPACPAERVARLEPLLRSLLRD
jgi:hypothetical protein